MFSLILTLTLALAGCSALPADADVPQKKEEEKPAPADTSLYSRFLIPESEGSLQKSFPGALGGGSAATGGRGGVVYHVTSLEDTKTEGTLRYAVSQKGPRTVVFDVAGVIALGTPLKITNPDITIAGQTAPGDGICLKNYTFHINASNVIIRFIRCRMGDETATADDAMSASHHDDSKCERIIIDHCSMGWSTDECASFYGNRDFTLQWCIMSESLRNSVHDKGKHGYCGLWGGENACFHHNLLAHHDSRNPRFDHDYISTCKGPVHFVNNLVYNWGNNSGYGGESATGASPRQINIVGNYYKPGPASLKCPHRIVNPTTKCDKCNDSAHQYDVIPGKFYISENVMCGSDEVTSDNWNGVDPDDKTKLDSVKAFSLWGNPGFIPESASAAYDKILSLCGASLARDSVDRRIIRETASGTYTFTGSNGSTGGLIDSQSDVGGWPEYKASPEQVSSLKDGDGDGMPDAFETEFGLNPSDASDGSLFTLDRYGRYTNLEMYLHYIVRNIITNQ